MKNKKMIFISIILVMTFVTLFSFSVLNVDTVFATESADFTDDSDDNTFIMDAAISIMPEDAYVQQEKPFSNGSAIEKIKGSLKAQQANAFEMTLSEACLFFGDHVMEFINLLMKEEVTVEKIIYNKVNSLNANFFTKSTNATKAPASVFIKKVVNTWYRFLSKIVIVIYLIALVAVGIMIMLGGAGRKADAKEIFTKWTMGIIIFYFFPYVMRYAFDLNESILAMINQSDAYIVSGSALGSGMSDLTENEIEERSPEYVTKSSTVIKMGSEEATEVYINKLSNYIRKTDLMRIMRAMAGVTGRMLYVILWFIMLFQLIIFIYIYYKRYLMIAFLIMIFPITLVEYILGTIVSGKHSALSSWCKEFFMNVFLQTIHAIIYAVVAGVVINQIRSALNGSNMTKINWLIFIVATNFVFTGEKIIRDIINAGGTESIKPVDEVGKDFRGRFKSHKDRIKKFAKINKDAN